MSDHLPESFSLVSILTEQRVHHQEGLLSQNNWPKITWKVIPQHHNAWDCQPCGRAVLLGSLTLLLSGGLRGGGQGTFSNKVSCFVSMCVSLDISFPSVRQEPSFGPWRGFPSCNTSFPNPWRRKKFSRAMISVLLTKIGLISNRGSIYLLKDLRENRFALVSCLLALLSFTKMQSYMILSWQNGFLSKNQEPTTQRPRKHQH